MLRCYTELKELLTFKDRFEYLRLTGIVGATTFGFDRYLNQVFYRSREWAEARDAVIIRDNGCDLGVQGFTIRDKIIVHHMNMITIEDLEAKNPWIFNPEYLICTSPNTHLAIHYSDESLIPAEPTERKPGDTTLWSRKL